MEKVFLADLGLGQQVNNIFQVKKKELIPFRGRPGRFLSLVLSDKSGEIEAKLWDRGEELAQEFVLHDFLVIKGVVTEYNKKLQITVESLKKTEVAEEYLTYFLPSSPREIGEMWQELVDLIATIKNPHLKALTEIVFSDDEIKRRFKRAPAAKTHHQAYLGGLLEHTLNVSQIAKKIGETYPATDVDLLLTGALFHDIGKIEEFSYERAIDYNDVGRLLGHITIGVNLIDQKIKSLSDFPMTLRLKVLHMILSHHGKYEWQSPKRPKFLEAAILHQADVLDAEVDKFVKAKSADSKERWNYVRNLERFVFRD